MIKKLLTVAIAGVALMACSDSVDREGTRDNIVDALESSGLTVDEGCIDDALDKYSDDELSKIDDQLEDGDDSGEAGELINTLIACATLGS